MTLIDTCLWIHFLRRSTPLNEGLTRLIQLDEVLGHPFIYGEILMGTGGPGRAELLRSYPDLSQAPVADHEAVVDLVLRHKLSNKGVGWVDAHLLASALAAGAELWTEDAALKRAARELRIAR